MKYKEFYSQIKEYASTHHLSMLDVHYLIKYSLNLTDQEKYKNIELSDEKVDKMYKDLKRLIKGEPLQYVVGTVYFGGHEFKTDPRALIPRFETEELVHHTIHYLHNYFDRPIRILDIGTGSGVIGITLKKECKDADVTLLDISKEALSLAKENASLLGADVQILESDMLTKVIQEKHFYDLVISNPPYLRETEEIMDVVKNNEPNMALFGGKDGLKYYRMILKDINKITKERFMIAFEIGDEQVEPISKLINQYLENVKIEVVKDMQGRNRMIFIFKNTE